MKKLISIVLALVLLCLPVFADGAAANVNADSLNKIGLLSGIAGDYKLADKLTRAQAATFIVKFLGADDEVAAMSSSTTFKDVKANAWYAKYIAYCSKNNIIGGYSDGTVKPDKNVTEKEFFVMVLKALGYTSADFTWTNLYQFAVTTGIVTDQNYNTFIYDNPNYTRGSVVDVLHTSLKVKFNGSVETPIQKLIADGAVTPAAAISAGLAKADVTVSSISTVTATTLNTVVIKMNEAVTSASGITVSPALTINETKVEGDTITLTTNDMTPATAYTLTVGTVADVDGNVTKALTKEFTGYIKQDVNSTFFKIKKIEAISKNQIDVYFTHPINTAAELQMFYEIKQGTTSFVIGSFTTMACAKDMSKENVVSIWIKEKTFNASSPYTLSIRGDFQSKYGAKIGNGSGDSMMFVASGAENTGLQIVQVNPIDTDVIELVFNKDLDPSSAQTTSNFTVVNKSGSVPMSILSAKVVGDTTTGQKSLRLKTIGGVTNSNYEITVKNVYDRLKATSIADEKVPFTQMTITNPLKIEAASAFDNGTVYLYFNKPMDPNITAVNFTGVSVNSKYFDQDIPNQVILYLNSGSQLTAGTKYTITSPGAVTDIMGKTQTGVTYDVYGTSQAPGTLYATGAKMISSNQVLLTLSSGALTTTAAGSFKLEYKEGTDTKTKTASSISFVNPSTVILTFDTLSTSTVYTVKGTNVKDYTNQYTTPSISSSIEVQN